MHILEFIQALESDQFLEQYATIIWRAEEYSALFFSRIYTHLKYHKKIGIIPISPADQVWQHAQAQLTTLFLGNKQYYWFSDFSHIDQATKENWYNFIQNYTGPHCLLVYIPKIVALTETKQQLIVEIPVYVSAELFNKLYNALFSFGAAVDPLFLQKLFSFHKNILLEDALRIMAYYQVLGRKYDVFLNNWLDKLLVPEKSLFTLSQYLFAQDKTLFLKHWLSVKADYPAEYWVVFWSEQIAQAITFVSVASTQSPLEARKLVNRLPFSFMNKDWKRFKIPFLAQAHQFLYDFDYNLKNGADDWGIELWYYKFLEHQL
jgi:hypothetical protein